MAEQELTRVVEVPLRRLDPWLAGFGRRHPDARVRLLADEEPGPTWLLSAPDGERAVVELPRWLASPAVAELIAGQIAGRPTASPSDDLSPPFAVLMVRRAGYAVAVFRGGAQVAGKVGKRHIHGRTAAGGWSQQRFARRRANQADEIAASTAATFEALVAPHAGELAALVTGGDRSLLAATRDLVERSPTARGLVPVIAAIPEIHLGISTPTAQTLSEVPDRVLAVRIHLTPSTEAGADHD